MFQTNHGSLHKAVLQHNFPPPYTFINGDFNTFPTKIWSKSVVHSLNPFKDAIKRLTTTVPPSITTTHHDGSLPSSLSCALANNNPLRSSMPTQCSGQHLRERCLFQNDVWKKWEAMQLADK
jgi:hypothetical protein